MQADSNGVVVIRPNIGHQGPQMAIVLQSHGAFITQRLHDPGSTSLATTRYVYVYIYIYVYVSVYIYI